MPRRDESFGAAVAAQRPRLRLPEASPGLGSCGVGAVGCGRGGPRRTAGGRLLVFLLAAVHATSATALTGDLLDDELYNSTPPACLSPRQKASLASLQVDKAVFRARQRARSPTWAAVGEAKEEPVVLLARRGVNRLSHRIVLHILNLVLVEALDTPTRVVDALGPDVPCDVDVESVVGAGRAWDFWISEDFGQPDKTNEDGLEDAGFLGYSSLQGLYVAPVVLPPDADLRLSFYKSYLDSTVVSLFPASGTAAVSTPCDASWNLAHPLPSGESWCSDGVGATGRYVPPQCQGASSCAELYHPDPSVGAGYVEQLVRNHGLSLTVAYVGQGPLAEVVRDTVSAGKRVLFFLDPLQQPGVLTSLSNFARVSFPRGGAHCLTQAAALAQDTPEGDGMCDFRETALHKKASSRLRSEAPFELMVLRSMTLKKSDIRGAIATHRVAGGSLDAFGAACGWLRANLEVASSWAPTCAAGYVLDANFLRCVVDCPQGEVALPYGKTSDCTPCTLGKYALLAADRWPSCEACAPGFYTDAYGLTLCLPCPAGTVNPNEGHWNCVSCKPGETPDAKVGAVKCVGCQAGRARDGDAIECSICDRGRFSLDGQGTCTACPPGRFNKYEGRTSCSDCQRGRAQPKSGQQECQPCQPGTFADNFSQAECTPCPAGLHPAIFEATSPSDCCDAESVFLGIYGCRPCPGGVACPVMGGASFAFDQLRPQSLELLPGFMVSNLSGVMPPMQWTEAEDGASDRLLVTVVYRCLGHDASHRCPGGLLRPRGPGGAMTACGTERPDLLLPNKIGCEVCVAGYAMHRNLFDHTDRRCVECGLAPASIIWIVLAVVPALWVYYIVVQPSRLRSSNSEFRLRFLTLLKIFPPFMQTLAVIFQSGILLPKTIEKKHTLVSLVGMAGFYHGPIQLECLHGGNVWMVSYVFRLMQPAGMGILLLLMHFLGFQGLRAHRHMRLRRALRQQAGADGAGGDISVCSASDLDRLEEAQNHGDRGTEPRDLQKSEEQAQNHSDLDSQTREEQVDQEHNNSMKARCLCCRGRCRTCFLARLVTGFKNHAVGDPEWVMMAERGRVMSAFGSIFSLMQIPIAMTSVTLFNSYEHPEPVVVSTVAKGVQPKRQFSVQEYPEVLMGSAEWSACVPIGLTSLLTFSIGFMVWMTYLNFQAPRMYSSTDPRARAKFLNTSRFLMNRFRPGVWWWGEATLIKDFIVAITPALVWQVEMRVMVLSAVVATYNLLQVKFLPWRYQSANYLEILMNTIVLMVIIDLSIYQRHDDEAMREVASDLLVAGLAFPFVGLIVAEVLVVQRFWKTSKHQDFRLALRFRQCMEIVSRLTTPELATLVSERLDDHDCGELRQVLTILYAELFKFQPSRHLWKQRLIGLANPKSEAAGHRNVEDNTGAFRELITHGDEASGIKQPDIIMRKAWHVIKLCKAIDSLVRTSKANHILTKGQETLTTLEHWMLKSDAPDHTAPTVSRKLSVKRFEYLRSNAQNHTDLDSQKSKEQAGNRDAGKCFSLKRNTKKANALTSAEFVYVYTHLIRPGAPDKDAQSIFELLDIDCAGLLTAEDFFNATLALGIDQVEGHHEKFEEAITVRKASDFEQALCLNSLLSSADGNFSRNCLLAAVQRKMMVVRIQRQFRARLEARRKERHMVPLVNRTKVEDASCQIPENGEALSPAHTGGLEISGGAGGGSPKRPRFRLGEESV